MVDALLFDHEPWPAIESWSESPSEKSRGVNRRFGQVLRVCRVAAANKLPTRPEDA